MLIARTRTASSNAIGSQNIIALSRRPVTAGAQAASNNRFPFSAEYTSVMAETKVEIEKTEDEWRRELTPEQFEVLRRHGTERAGTSPLNYEKRDGVFCCAGCGAPLFAADTKFESGTGWPSFWAPLDGAVKTTTDRSHFMTRIEVQCAKCG